MTTNGSGAANAFGGDGRAGIRLLDLTQVEAERHLMTGLRNDTII